MYPLVELLTGLLFVVCYLQFGLTQAAVKWLFFTGLVIVLTIIDLRVRMLPDLVTWPGVVTGLFFSAVIPPYDGAALSLFQVLLHRMPPTWVLGLVDGILGAVFGSLLLWGVATLYKRLRGREGMGMGDVKMMAMVGAFLGLRATFFTILLGTLLGTIVGVAMIAVLYVAGWRRPLAARASRRGLGTEAELRWFIVSQYQLPLGSFLGVAALLIAYFGPQLIDHWTNLLRGYR